MAIGPRSICDIFPLELLNGAHNFGTDVFKLALYTDTADLSNATTDYIADDEVVGPGYLTGGFVVQLNVLQEVRGSGKATVVSMDELVIPAQLSISFLGGLIYNSTLANNNAIGIENFGTTQQVNQRDAVFRLANSVNLFEITH